MNLLQQVHNRAIVFFSEVCNALCQMSEKVSGLVLQEGGNKASDFRHLIVELEGMLQKEREEFEVACLNFIATFLCSPINLLLETRKHKVS